MDYLYFLQKRLGFLRRFYDVAAAPFEETKRKIDAREAPFDEPPWDESGEPPFLEEWQDSEQSLDVLGRACLSFATSAFHVFLREYDEDFRREWGGLVSIPEFDFKNAKTVGWLKEYQRTYASIDVDFARSGADLAVIEESILLRNLVQHPDGNWRIGLWQNRDYRSKFPRPYFADPFYEQMIDAQDWENPLDLDWALRVPKDKLLGAMAEVEKLAEWLYRDGWEPQPP